MTAPVAVLNFFVITIVTIIQAAELCSSSGNQEKLARFARVFNGFFSNIEDLNCQARTYGHDEIKFNPMMVDIPAFKESTNFYFEELINDQLYRQSVLAFTIDDGGLINGTQYNFTDPSRVNPFNPAVLQDLTIEDFETIPSRCKLTYREINTNVFYGSWTDCNEATLEEIPFYTSVMAPSVFSFTAAPQNHRESGSLVPYLLHG